MAVVKGDRGDLEGYMSFTELERCSQRSSVSGLRARQWTYRSRYFYEQVDPSHLIEALPNKNLPRVKK